jgi:acetylornithine deacetylase
MKAKEAIDLLQKLISTPSFSGEEIKTAGLIIDILKSSGYEVNRLFNNVWVKSRNWNEQWPTILLNSHHDTVKPNSSYTRDPFLPEIIDSKLYGLGSNDAGGALVALLATFINMDQTGIGFNLIFAASAEEEISGKQGMEAFRDELPKVDMAIVGEPTKMQMAIAEKGLMVLDICSYGKPGHAARNEGVNAIYEALPGIQWIRNYRFPKESSQLGEIKMTVTQINAGSQHNVAPDRCQYVVDVRSTDAYNNEEILEIIRKNIEGEVVARSTRLQPSGLPTGHPMFTVAEKMNIKVFGSPTLSDQALLRCDSIKIGPGDSARSHTADEFIYLEEIEEAIQLYPELIKNYIELL